MNPFYTGGLCGLWMFELVSNVHKCLRAGRPVSCEPAAGVLQRAPPDKNLFLGVRLGFIFPLWATTVCCTPTITTVTHTTNRILYGEFDTILYA